MKKILAVLIAALMICLTFVPAQAATLVDFLPYAKLICEAIKTFSTAGADIHKAYPIKFAGIPSIKTWR